MKQNPEANQELNLMTTVILCVLFLDSQVSFLSKYKSVDMTENSELIPKTYTPKNSSFKFGFGSKYLEYKRVIN
jgi:hypothetical protein